MEHPGKTLPEFQRFHEWMDREKGFSKDLNTNTLLLQTEVGELTKEVLRYQWRMDKYGPDDPQVEETRLALGSELADCLAYLLKLANCTGHDLQTVYTDKMLKNIRRVWTI